MPAYAIAHLTELTPHPDIPEYIERIQATLDPFSGRFLVHGAEVEVLEGAWPGDVVVIEFPDTAAARAWYDSPAYRELLPLRTEHIKGDVILVGGVAPGYDPATTAAKVRESLPQS
ncbi:DUF1330 domain-containing protein [Streptomyces sp. JJ38]|uniref:DUF1330 domain-containing protein n=1 Tax=Streptomyces sp. JJ38 TaxID=2738128 RepID=UPI001C57E836|nr:DUF1330 domain-containing protein [Streptomyces sp. JJ38]MBW1596895.1 DUF1330 domain-containing protein [Streptomyces sp. JJ38]